MSDFEDQYQKEDVTMNMERKKMRTALTIAGSDSSGGAGIQADIKTMTVNGVYAMSAVTALTAQNTVGVKAIMEASPEFLEEQLDCIFTDIRPDAVKIGMLSSAALMRTVARKLKEYQAENIVVDPVMVSTSGSRLMAEEAVQVMKEEICPLADVITPEPAGSGSACGKNDRDGAGDGGSCRRDQQSLPDGGTAERRPSEERCQRSFMPERFSPVVPRKTDLDNPNTHGTGCTLSSAIAANLAKGFPLEESVGTGERIPVRRSGGYAGSWAMARPMNHGFDLKEEYRKVKV